MNIYYEYSYFLKPTSENEITEITEKIKEEIKKKNCVILEESHPFQKRLSYVVKKQKDGFFGTIKFIAEPENANLLVPVFKNNKDILRFFIKKIIKKSGTRNDKKRNARHFVKKLKPQTQSQNGVQIAEIDKKLEELLGNNPK